MTDLALAIVGAGRLAEAGYLPALVRARGVRLVTVVDPDPLRRERIAQVAHSMGLGNVTTRRHATDLADLPGLDAAIIASPVGTHVDNAAFLASAGLAVLVEKPPAPDAAGAQRLAALDPAPWIGFNRRFDPGAAAVRNAIVATEGPVILDLSITYRRQSWGAVSSADDALLDLGPHLVDWARWMSRQDVVGVSCGRADHDGFELELELAHGRATITAATDQPYAERVEAYGADGSLVARHRLGGIVDGVIARVQRRGSPLVEGLANQLEALARAASGASEPDLATAADGVAVMSILDAARASFRLGGTTTAPSSET